MVYIDVSEVLGRPAVPIFDLPLPEELGVSVAEEICRRWLEEHPEVDAVILTSKKLYLDPFGFPHAVVVESRPVAVFAAPGWTVETFVLPIPRGIPPDAIAGVLTNTGAKLAERGFLGLAEIYYRRALHPDPNLKETWNNLGRLLTDLGRLDEALKCLDKALELDSNYASALINKGIALAKLGRYIEAIKNLDEASILNPNNEKAWYNKALVHFIMGQRGEARESVSKALKINPNYEAAKKLKELLEKSQGK
ncbi:MAG: tetratricopeptide repeat protein [Candidatus Freyarchaeota archaeon]